MSWDVFGGTLFDSRHLIRLMSLAIILFFGLVGIVFALREGNRRRAGATALFTVAMLSATKVSRWLPFSLKHWSLLLLMFGASVYFGVDGWLTLRREPLVTPAFKYSMAGLLASVMSLLLMFLLPRQLIPVLIAIYIALFVGVAGCGAWIVKHRPSTLTDGLWTASLLLFFLAMWLVLGFLTAALYGRRGWLAL